jgi:lipoate-protein ligase A
MIVRVLPHLVMDGSRNMALDEALLESVSEQPIAAVLRTYGWSKPTLSLGYFQPYLLTESEPRWRGVPIVRRPTGGGALWHDREITYALVLPRAHPAAARTTELYRGVHDAIVNLLRVASLPAMRRGEPADLENSREEPFLCFTRRDPEDIVIGADKVVGSAQRRRPAAVLQHGSLLLARSRTTPELPGLAELSRPDRPIVPTDWTGSLTAAIAAAFGLEPREDMPTVAESRRAEALVVRYSEPSWTRRR